jgi:hypothetical protein
MPPSHNITDGLTTLFRIAPVRKDQSPVMKRGENDTSGLPAPECAEMPATSLARSATNHAVSPANRRQEMLRLLPRHAVLGHGAELRRPVCGRRSWRDAPGGA